MNKDNIEKFVKFGKELDSDSVMCMMIGELILGVIGIVWSNEPKKSIIVILPFVIISCIIYVIFQYKKHLHKTQYTHKKYINLYLGILGILASLTCQSCCLMYINAAVSTIIIILGALVLSNFLIMLGIFIIIKKIIMGAIKIRSTAGVCSGLIASCALFGVLMAEHIDQSYEKLVMSICFAGLSWVFSAFIAFILKYYCLNLLDKLNNNTK